MVLTPHILAGAVIGSEIKNIWLIAGLGLASHYFLDSLPHWDYLTEINPGKIKDMAKIGLDILIGLSLVWLIVEEINWYLIIGIFFALLPDLFQFLYLGFNFSFLERLTKFHNFWHNKKKYSFIPGFSVTLFCCLFLISILVV